MTTTAGRTRRLLSRSCSEDRDRSTIIISIIIIAGVVEATSGQKQQQGGGTTSWTSLFIVLVERGASARPSFGGGRWSDGCGRKEKEEEDVTARTGVESLKQEEEPATPP